jgi:hypothetical protein
VTTPQIPPDTAAAGQTGHIEAHNQISEVLTAMAAQLGAVPPISWGTATLVSGSVSVTLPAVDAESVVLVSRMTPSGTIGHLSVPSVTPGTGFTITSSSASDNSLVGYAVLG